MIGELPPAQSWLSISQLPILRFTQLFLLTHPAIATGPYPRYPANSETSQKSSHENMANLFELPRYIAVEGPIRVGKSTLAGILAERLNAQRVMEPEANPFLHSFYEGDRGAAFQAQFTFLVRRFEQLEVTRPGRAIAEDRRLGLHLRKRQALCLPQSDGPGTRYLQSLLQPLPRATADARTWAVIYRWQSTLDAC